MFRKKQKNPYIRLERIDRVFSHVQLKNNNKKKRENSKQNKNNPQWNETCNICFAMRAVKYVNAVIVLAAQTLQQRHMIPSCARMIE